MYAFDAGSEGVSFEELGVDLMVVVEDDDEKLELTDDVVSE